MEVIHIGENLQISAEFNEASVIVLTLNEYADRNNSEIAQKAKELADELLNGVKFY